MLKLHPTRGHPGHASPAGRVPAPRVRLLAAGAIAAGIAAVGAPRAASAAPAPAAPRDAVATPVAGVRVTTFQDSLAGRSGKLRALFVSPARTETFPFLRRLLGDAFGKPGVHTVESDEAQEARGPFTYITLLPFGAKVNGRIGRYRIGAWPNELGARLLGKYGNPEGFIQVTPENQATYVSEHFRLRDFLTKDQVNVWPKYLVLDPDLVDKLELVLDDLRARGYDAKRLHVMSGFRTPQYNTGGGDPRGRADLSRHQYGDAADVWVENGAGRMADLNRDGRIDTKDAAIVAESAERVERAHPDLVGGVGLYRATSAHGPFVHIDTRGTRARWGHA